MWVRDKTLSNNYNQSRIDADVFRCKMCTRNMHILHNKRFFQYFQFHFLSYLFKIVFSIFHWVKQNMYVLNVYEKNSKKRTVKWYSTSEDELEIKMKLELEKI